ncbi:MAG: diguanylate cyclase [Labilithrix sp.]|nr:diguanylate cyclase [Labilithrix sp.]
MRIILIDPSSEARDLLARRLRALDYTVECAPDGLSGAELALSAPPAAVIADLWMPGVSGVQLCRLLRTEPATKEVPIVLRAERDDPRNRFWANCAGATGFVASRRMGELVRLLEKVAVARDDAFFMHFGAGVRDVRDRIARTLDQAMFESVIAGEVRALAGACSVARLFDSLSQLTSQLLTYRWLGLSTLSPVNVAVHAHPSSLETAEAEARRVLRVGPAVCALSVVDGDAAAFSAEQAGPTVSREIVFGGTPIGRIALAPTGPIEEAEEIVELLARDLGGAIRMAALVESSQRMASTDALTQLPNRRAFVENMRAELSRTSRDGASLSLLMLDVDRFKAINDTRGHAAGDAVLTELGRILPKHARDYDLVARWGGEEFVVALPSSNRMAALIVAERLRQAVANMSVADPAGGAPLMATVSIGAATQVPGDSLDSLLERADRALYAAKLSGRDCVYVLDTAHDEPRRSDVRGAEEGGVVSERGYERAA